jgi:uncharacterized protein
MPDTRAPAPIGDAEAPFSDNDLARLDTLLQAVPSPLQPLDLSALDGYLCGVLLQPQRPPPSRWLPFVTDIEGRPLPASAEATELLGLVRRRHAALEQAIAQRQWFDPWIYLHDSGEVSDEDSDEDDDEGQPQDRPKEATDAGDDTDPAEAVLPWVAGFAAAMEHFPDLMALTDPALVEPLALLFMHFDADDLEDADALLAMIQTLEPASDLAEAVQDIVRALMLIADVTRPVHLNSTKAVAGRDRQAKASRAARSRRPSTPAPTHRRPR